MSRNRPVSLDFHVIADGSTALDQENFVGQGSGSIVPVAPDASLFFADSLFAEALEMAALDQETADGMLNSVPVADEGEHVDAAAAEPNGGGGMPNDWDLATGLADYSLQATGLSEWHIFTMDGTLLTANDMPRFGSGDHDAFFRGPDFFPSAGSAHEFPAAGGLIFLDLESYARPSSPGGGGSKKNGGGGGGDSGDSGGSNAVSEFLSGPDGGYNILIDFKGSWTVLLQDAFCRRRRRS